MHVLRKQRTPNAKARGHIYVASKETDWNLVGRDGRDSLHDSIFSPVYWIRNYKKLLSDKGVSKWRTDAVFAVEQLAHFSREIFRGGTLLGDVDHDLGLEVLRDTLAFQRKEYGELLLVFVGHCDEQTIHAHSYLVPLEFKLVKPAGRSKKQDKGVPRTPVAKWVLAAKTSFFPEECSDLQTRFAAFMRSRGHDMNRGIKGSRADHQTMAAHMKLIYSPVPEVPAFALGPDLTGPASTLLNPQEFARLVLERADNWRQEIVETIIPPLRARALEHQGAVKRCEDYQETARMKEIDNQKYRERLDLLENELAAANSLSLELKGELIRRNRIPSLDDVARRILGSDRVRSLTETTTTYRLPDGKELEIDSNTGVYRRERVGSNRSETVIATGGGVIDLIGEITGWNISHALSWIDTQWGTQGVTACLAQSNELDFAERGPEFGQIRATVEFGSLGALLVSREQMTWESARKVLVDRYKFTPESIDDFASDGLLASNGFGDLLTFSPGSPPLRPQVYPLANGVVIGDGTLPPEGSFSIGSGKEVLVVVESPLEALAIWEFLPKSMRPIASVAVAAEVREPEIWGELWERFPTAKLFNALPRNAQTPNRGDMQGYFPEPSMLLHGEFKTWAIAWKNRAFDEQSAVEFGKVQDGIIEEFGALSSPEMGDPV